MIDYRRLGADGPGVGALGLGCMGMSWCARQMDKLPAATGSRY